MSLTCSVAFCVWLYVPCYSIPVDSSGAAEGDKSEEHAAAAADGVNDSTAPGDLTADLTIDSVKVHLRYS